MILSIFLITIMLLTFLMTFSMSGYCNYVTERESELTRDPRSQDPNLNALSPTWFASAKPLLNTKFPEIKVNNCD